MPAYSIYSALGNRFLTDKQGDLEIVRDEFAVGDSIENILSTRIGERVFRREFGSRLTDLLFEPITPTTAVFIQMEIFGRISASGEDRLIIEQVRVVAQPDLNAYNVDVFYRLKNLPDRSFDFRKVLRSSGVAS